MSRSIRSGWRATGPGAKVTQKQSGDQGSPARRDRKAGRLAFLAASCFLLAAQAPGQAVDGKGRSIEEIERGQRESRLKWEERAAERQRAWQRLRERAEIRASTVVCLAHRPATRECLVDVAQFNAQVANSLPNPRSPDSMPPEDGRSLARIRDEALRALLDRAYTDYLAERSEAGKTAGDSAAHGMSPGEEAGLRDSALARIYAAYHPFLFQAEERSRFRMLAATDSAFLDSAGKEARRNYRAATRTWTQTGLDLIPASLHAEARRLPPGHCGGPWFGGFGYFLVCLDARELVPEVPFRQALPLLRRLRSLGKEKPRITEGEIRDYQREHREDFRSPDTLVLTLWLSPSRPLCDTLCGVPGLPALQFQLPAAVEDRLSARGGLRRGEIISLGRIAYAEWTLRVEDIRKGTGYLPPDTVRILIEDVLKARSLETVRGIGKDLQRKEEEGAMNRVREGSAHLSRNEWLEREVRVDSTLLQRY